MSVVARQVSLPPVNMPVIDKNGLINAQWYKWFEQMQLRTGGDQDAVAGNTIEIQTKADATIDIMVGNGLEGGGTLEGNITISAKEDTGWTAASGAGDKTAYTQYIGHTAGASYSQAQAQETDDAIKATSARLVAIELALRANGAIDG